MLYTQVARSLVMLGMVGVLLEVGLIYSEVVRCVLF